MNKMNSNKIQIADIEYSYESYDDSLSISATYKNLYTFQLFKWKTKLNPSNFQQVLRIKNEQADWEQVKSIIQQIYKQSFNTSFSDDHNQDVLRIECTEAFVKKMLGEFVIELPRTKSKDLIEKFNKVELLIRGDKEGPNRENVEKILSKLTDLSNFCSENQILTSYLANENNSLKSEIQMLKGELEKKQREINLLNMKSNRGEIGEKEKFSEEKEIQEYKVDERDTYVDKQDVQSEMLKIMKNQLEKLDNISNFLQYNQSIREDERKERLRLKEEKMKRKEEKANRIKGMEESCLPIKEMSILKTFMKEAGLFNGKSCLRLIYKALRDGFSATDFHKRCDFKPKNLVVIKANDYFFGGYTSSAWGSKQGWVENKDTFIFSLSNPTNFPVRMICKYPQKSIYDFTSFGPIFGGGSDIYIADKSNENTNSYSDLGFSFDGCPFPYTSSESKKFLCGQTNFKVQELEVYQLY